MFSRLSTPARARSTMLQGAAVSAAFALAALAVSPSASAQPEDRTEAGQVAVSSSELPIPDGVQLGSIGGAPLTEVGHVDPERYAGTWYQLAAIPQPFNLQCVANTTAEYEVTSPSTLSVRNSCDRVFGGRSSIDGEARVTNEDTNASLRVAFSGVPGQDANGPTNYRITYLADDYSLAIVGSPDRSSGFVLSRTPDLSDDRWNEVRGIIAERGWTDCAFLTSPTTGGHSGMTPLCLR